LLFFKTVVIQAENFNQSSTFTKMKFVNDKLVEQSNYKIDTVDKKLEELRIQLETNGRRINMLRRTK